MTEPVYVPKIGDTIRDPLWPEGNTAVVKFVGDHFVIGDKSWAPDVAFHREGAWDRGAAWVKVEPTPADRYAVCHDEAGGFCWLRTEGAKAYALNFDGARVARFTFAEWIEL